MSSADIGQDGMLYTNGIISDNGFIPPSPPSKSALPKTKLGKDKHKMPFYAHNERNRIVRTTAYTHSESDHLAYGRKNAIGTSLKYTKNVRSAAADWSVYPLGTKFRIKGQPYLYVVDDYGSAMTGTGTIDIYQPSKNLMRQWGRQYVEITVVQWGSFEKSAEILATRKSWSHCRQMLASIERKMSSGGFASR